jgi:DNA mismatch endonuclease (patch repair protein)
MLGNRARDTTPELAVRRLLHRSGLRYRVDVRPDRSIRRKADIVFPRQKVAIFIDGCFWHGCPADFVLPKTNQDYWTKKIGGNLARDLATTAALEGAGWKVLRFWSHEDPAVVANQIAADLQDLKVRDN